jgi:hypothetical protein
MQKLKIPKELKEDIRRKVGTLHGIVFDANLFELPEAIKLAVLYADEIVDLLGKVDVHNIVDDANNVNK